MKPRSVQPIFVYQILTLGIYSLFWCWRSKNEVNQKAKKVQAPSIWWFLLPFGCYWWAWQYAHAVEEATKRKIGYVDSFGYFLVASMIVLGSFYLPIYPSISSSKGSIIAWSVIGIVSIVAFAIFPAAMQSRFNKLKT